MTVANAASAATMHYSITPANNTFSNTCPLLINYEASNKIVPSTCANIVAGVYVAKPPVTNLISSGLFLLAGDVSCGAAQRSCAGSGPLPRAGAQLPVD